MVDEGAGVELADFEEVGFGVSFGSPSSPWSASGSSVIKGQAFVVVVVVGETLHPLTSEELVVEQLSELPLTLSQETHKSVTVRGEHCDELDVLDVVVVALRVAGVLAGN